MTIIGEFVFIIFAFILFMLVFFRMIKKNDTGYVIILAMQAIGIGMDLIKLICQINNMNILFILMSWILAVILPIMILIFRGQEGNLEERILMLKVKINLFFKNNKNAKENLLKIINKKPQNCMAHKMLAEIYEHEGGLRRAAEEYIHVIEIQKSDFDTYYKIASIFNELDRKDEASQVLENLLERKPDHLQGALLFGDLLMEQERYKEAVNIYLDMEKLYPGNFEIYYNLGMVYSMLNDFQNAKTYYEMAATVNSLVYNTKYSLAEIALIYKELDDAENKFLEVVGNPDLEADAYLELAKISLIKKDKEKAINYANIAIESNPKKIVGKIKNDDIFITIIAKLTIPFNLEFKEERKSKLTNKEKKVKNHLEKTSDVTRDLSYNDIKLLNKLKKEDRKTDFANEMFIRKEREQ